MGFLLPPGLETAPIKDALRGMRHALGRGRETLETSLASSLPPPAASLARSFLQDIGHIARGIDHVAHGVAMSVLGTTPVETAGMNKLMMESEDGRFRFTDACYEALKMVLRRMGEARPLVNEAAILRATARVSRQQSGEQTRDVMQMAAEFTLYLLAEHPVRNLTLRGSDLKRETQEPVVVFAAVLSLLVEDEGSERPVILGSATDLSMVLAEEIRDACGDSATLAALYRKYAAHV